MNIIPNKFPEETEITEWLVFDSKEEAEISLVFARRLSALARDNNRKIYISEGYRSTERQKYFYDLYLAGKGNLAAKPNTSLHEFHVAVDIGDPKDFWRNKSEREWNPSSKFSQISLNKYGICLPLNKRERLISEWWHIVPIEFYRDYHGELKDFMQDDDKILDWDKEIQRANEIKYILEKLSLVVESLEYWEKVLKSKVIANPVFLTQLLSKIFASKDVLYLLTLKGIITAKDYWKNVFDGSVDCNPEYLKVVLLKLL